MLVLRAAEKVRNNIQLLILIIRSIILVKQNPRTIPVMGITKTDNHTTLSGTPGGGRERFLGGHLLSYDLLSNLHSPIFP